MLRAAAAVEGEGAVEAPGQDRCASECQKTCKQRVKALAEEKRKKREIRSEAKRADAKKPQRARDPQRNALQPLAPAGRMAKRLFAAAPCKFLGNHIGFPSTKRQAAAQTRAFPVTSIAGNC